MAADSSQRHERAVVETHARSVVKGLVWRILATMATITLVYGFTGKPMVAMEVGGLEVIVKLLLYYGHERAWNNIRWGRREFAAVPVEASAVAASAIVAAEPVGTDPRSFPPSTIESAPCNERRRRIECRRS